MATNHLFYIVYYMEAKDSFIVEARGLRAYSTALSEVPTAKLQAAAEAVGVEARKVFLTAAEVSNVLREAEAPL